MVPTDYDGALNWNPLYAERLPEFPKGDDFTQRNLFEILLIQTEIRLYFAFPINLENSKYNLISG